LFRYFSYMYSLRKTVYHRNLVLYI
jgi:hypothetical protein